MPSMTPNRRTLVKVEVVDVEKRRVPSKHYSYVINISWSDNSETVIYRRYSKFFEFQIILLETFPWEGGLKEPSARIIPFLPGKILFRRSHVRDVAIKRLKPIDEYCKGLVLLPPRISHCDHVLDFFEPRQEDFNPIREESRRRRNDEQVTRSQSLRYVRRTRSLEIGEISGPLLLEPYVAIADYNSTQQKELTISVGQRLEVIEKNENGWWFVSDEEGERGWVPGVYLEKPDGTSEDLVTKRAEPGHGEHYITTQGYTAENADDISFGAGVIVEVLQKNLEGWWLVSYGGRQGFAPASYLERSHNWVPESRGVEIIASVHDLKQHRHSLPSNSLSSISLPSQRIINIANAAIRSKDTDSITEEPRSPVSPTYKKEKTVQPPPKRSSVKRTTKKRPDLPPPLPPTITEEPTYEYMTIAQFDSTIPDGVSFDEEKKVKVLEKSPGGWWFVKIDGEEGWAPASYIEKREAMKKKTAVPSRPKPPSAGNKSSEDPEVVPTKHFSPVRKVPSVPNAICHPILEKVSSMPSSFSQSALSPAKRPLPPLPKPLTASQAMNDAETYEEVGLSQPQREAAPPKPPHLPSTFAKTAQPSSEKSSENTTNSGPIDFRSVLKSSIAAKHTEIKNKSNAAPSQSSHVTPRSSEEDEPKQKSNSVKCRTESKLTPPKLPSAKKPATSQKLPNQPERPNSLRKTSISKPSNAKPTGLKKPSQPLKVSNEAPKLPFKPKVTTSSNPGQRKMSHPGDGAITDFRSVLRSTQRKQSDTSSGVGRSHSFSADRVLSTKTRNQQNKPPSLPKKPGNLPAKPAVLNKPNTGGEDGTVKPSAVKKTGTRPPWNAGTKPVLRRYQNNNNSNCQETAKKPVFTVGHAKVEITRPPNLGQILTKRGSPDGQVDVKFVDGGKENTTVPVTPPERKKKATRRSFDKGAVKTASQETSQSKNALSNTCITISSYTGVEDSEISFDCGVKAEVLDRAENDWWYVQIGDNMGWAPSSFFRPTSASDFPEKASYISPDDSHQPAAHYDDVYAEIPENQSLSFPALYVAAADFEADQSSTLSLHVGDKVTVTQEADGGWWYAILSNGAGEGWVPSSYLDPAS